MSNPGATTSLIIEILDIAIKGQAALGMLRSALDAAAAEGRDLTAAERQAVLDRAGIAHDRLDQAIAERS